MEIRLDERFWSKVRKTEGHWYWLPATDRSGQLNAFMVGRREDGRPINMRPHKCAWIAAGRTIPDGHDLIQCDEPGCMRPEHSHVEPRWTRGAKAVAARPRPTREENIKRFMRYVEFVPAPPSWHPNGCCWLWNGYLPNGKDGYGGFWLDGQRLGAHVASHELFKGPVPEGMVVRHGECSIKRCVAPDALSYGTPQDNVDDTDKYNRRPRGQRKRNALLGDTEVAALRGEYRLGMPGETTRLSLKYGISEIVVSSIIHGRAYSHVTTELGSIPSNDPPYVLQKARGEKHHNAQLMSESVISMRERRAAGEKVEDLAREFRIGNAQVSAICIGRFWAHVGGPRTHGRVKR